jgi:hypothetical protein
MSTTDHASSQAARLAASARVHHAIRSGELPDDLFPEPAHHGRYRLVYLTNLGFSPGTQPAEASVLEAIASRGWHPANMRDLFRFAATDWDFGLVVQPIIAPASGMADPIDQHQILGAVFPEKRAAVALVFHNGRYTQHSPLLVICPEPARTAAPSRAAELPAVPARRGDANREAGQ